MHSKRQNAVSDHTLVLVSVDHGNAHAFQKSNTYEVVLALQRHFEFTTLILQEIF